MTDETAPKLYSANRKGRLEQMQRHLQRGHVDLAEFYQFGPTCKMLERWGLLARADVDRGSDAYAGYRPTTEGLPHFIVDEAHHLIMVRREAKDALIARHEQALLGEIAEALNRWPVEKRLAFSRGVKDMEATHSYVSQGTDPIRFTDYRGEDIHLPMSLFKRRLDRSTMTGEDSGGVYHYPLDYDLSTLPLACVPHAALLGEALQAPHEVYDLLLPGGLPSRRYVRFVPGLAFFVLTTAGPAPRRIYDWFGVECPSEQPGHSEAMHRINAERMGQLIQADAKVSRGRQ